MTTITIIIPGTPIGKPRMTQRDKWKRRPAVVRYREWCDRARAIAGELPDPSEIASFSWTAYFKPAKSWSKRRTKEAIGKRHRQKPDRDNIDKAVLDCFFKEDSGIADGVIRKRWAETARLEITIELTESSTKTCSNNRG